MVAIHKHTIKYSLVKIFRKQPSLSGKKYDIESVNREINILKCISHSNITRMMDYFES